VGEVSRKSNHKRRRTLADMTESAFWSNSICGQHGLIFAGARKRQ